MRNPSTLLAIPCVLLVASCAIDPADVVEDDVTTGTVEAETTVLDNCAVGHDENAFIGIFSAFESYTRKGDPKINYDCECKAWQKDANNLGEAQADLNHPQCRKETVVDIKWNVWFPNLAYAVTVPSWSLTNGDIECENSTLAVSYWKKTGPNQYTFQHQGVWHPQVMSDGTCSSLTYIGIGAADGSTYRIKALATRGLDDNNHGFETVKISGYVPNW